MSAVLRGTVEGANRADLFEEARKTATAYFGEQCLDVTLRNEATIETESSMNGTVVLRRFGADFSAKVSHKLGGRAHGPDECMRCHQDSWPQRPLPTALLSDEEGDRG